MRKATASLPVYAPKRKAVSTESIPPKKPCVAHAATQYESIGNKEKTRSEENGLEE